MVCFVGSGKYVLSSRGMRRGGTSCRVCRDVVMRSSARRFRLDEDSNEGRRSVRDRREDAEKLGVDRVVNDTLRLLDRGEENDAMEEFERVRKMDIVPTTYTYNKLISVLGRKGMMKETERVYNDMVECGVAPDFVTLSTMLSRYSEMVDIEAMERTYRRMKENEIRPNTMTFKLLMEGFFSVRDYQSADDIYQEMLEMNIEPDIHLFHKIMRLKLMTGEPEAVTESFAALRQRKIQPTYEIYLTLIEAYVNMGRVKKAVDLIKMMRKKGTKPDEVPFSKVSKVFAEKGDAEGQDRLFRLLYRFRFATPTALTYNHLIEAHGKQHGIQEAEAKLEKMLLMEIQPDADTLNCFLRLYDEYNEVERIETITERLRNLGVIPNSEGATLLVATYADRKDVEKAESRLQELIDSGIAVKDEAFAAILRAHCELGDVDVAEERMKRWLNTHESCFDTHCDIGVESFNALLSGVSRAGRVERALELVEEMKVRKLRPSMTSYTFVLDAMMGANLRTEIFDLLKKLREQGLRPNGWPYEVLVRRYCEGDKLFKARKVIAEMERVGLAYGATTFGHFIGAFTRKGEADRVMETIQQMDRKNIPPNEESLRVLTRATRDNPEEYTSVLRVVAKMLRRRPMGKVPPPERKTVSRQLDLDDAYSFLIANMTST